jgi:hypothetical protein
MADVWRPANPTQGDGCCGRFILFGVSSDADPSHPWKALLFPTRVPMDNVKLGLDKNGLYATEFGLNAGEPFKGAVLAVPKADLLWKGSSKPSLAHLNRLELDPGTRLSDNKLPGVEGIIPAIDFDPKKKASDPEICVNRFRREAGGETIIQVRKITWTSPIQAAISEPVEVGLGAHYPVQPTRRAVQPPLPAGMVTPGLNAGEGRLVNAVVRHGSVWSVAATDVNDRIGGFWFQIDAFTNKLVQHGTVADAQADLLFPSLSVDADGNLGIAVMRTSATEAASTYVTGRMRDDPANTLQPLARAVEGHYTYFNKNTDLTKPNQGAPTSDYANTSLDPNDRTLFWSNQFAATNNSLPQQENGGKYATHWVAFRVSVRHK